MAFTKFEKDVENISALPDEPSQEDGYTAKMIKSLFDKAAVELKDYINNTLLPQLESDMGASLIGSGAISGLDSEGNVFSQICAIKTMADNIKSGGVDAASITPDKLDEATQDFIRDFNFRCAKYTAPGGYIFTAPRSGLYKVTVMGGGAAGSYEGGGMSGAYGVKWITLSRSQSVSVIVGSGGTTRGEGGQDSSFGQITAEGGKPTASLYTEFSTCTNTDITVDGMPSVCRDLADNIERRCGGDSPLGRGSRTESHVAGMGAGGFGESDVYTVGGNGMVIIEYMHIQ